MIALFPDERPAQLQGFPSAKALLFSPQQCTVLEKARRVREQSPLSNGSLPPAHSAVTTTVHPAKDSTSRPLAE